MHAVRSWTFGASVRLPASRICGRRYPVRAPRRFLHATNALRQAPEERPSNEQSADEPSGSAEEIERARRQEKEKEDAEKLKELRRPRQSGTYGSGARRATRQREPPAPPPEIPQWFLDTNVALCGPFETREDGFVASDVIVVTDKKTGSELLRIPGTLNRADPTQDLGRRVATFLEPLVDDDSDVANTSLTSRLQERLGTEEAEARNPELEDVVDALDDPPSSISYAEGTTSTLDAFDQKQTKFLRPHVATMLTLELTIAASLATARYENTKTTASSKSNIHLSCLGNDKTTLVVDRCKQIATSLGADVITFDAQDLAELASGYVTDTTRPEFDFSKLSYDVYRSTSDDNDVDAEQQDYDEDEDGEPRRPKPPALNLLKQIFKAPGKGAQFKPIYAAPGVAAMHLGPFTQFEPPEAIDEDRPDPQFSTKLNALLEAIIDSSKARRESLKAGAAPADLTAAETTEAQQPQQHQQVGAVEGVNSGEVSTAEPEAVVAQPEKSEHDGAPQDLTEMFAGLKETDLSLTLHPSAKDVQQQSAIKEDQSPATIILIRDLREMLETELGMTVAKRLSSEVKRRRSKGERLMIIGVSDADGNMDSDDIAKMIGSELGDTFMRDLDIFYTKPDESKSSEAEAEPVPSEPPAYQSAAEMAETERQIRINRRNFQTMTRSLKPDFDGQANLDILPDRRSLSRNLETWPSEFNVSGERRIYGFDRVHHITLLAIGIQQMYAPHAPLSPLHFHMAVNVDLARLAHEDSIQLGDLKDILAPSKTKDSSSAAEEAKEKLQAIRKDATKHEKRLLNGVKDPSSTKTTFDKVHVAQETIDALKTLTSLSLVRPEAFKYGVLAQDTIPGLLLYGPPGTGKTLLAKAVAKESGATMLEVSGSEVNDMYVGESEKIVAGIFNLARKLSPCVVFIDEADAIFRSRSGDRSHSSHRDTINQFLKEWDGMNDANVFIMVATNRPFDLDDAVLRRLPRRLLVDLPTETDREAILRIHLSDENLDPSISLSHLAQKTPFYSGSDLKNLCVAAALSCVREENETAAAAKAAGDKDYSHPEKRTLHSRHFDKALQEISASISEDMDSLKAVKKFDEQYGDKRAKKKKSGWGFGESNMGSGEDRARVRAVTPTPTPEVPSNPVSPP